MLVSNLMLYIGTRGTIHSSRADWFFHTHQLKHYQHQVANSALITSMWLAFVYDMTKVRPDSSRYGCATPAYTKPPPMAVALYTPTGCVHGPSGDGAVRR
jgi:hypothetical protein